MTALEESAAAHQLPGGGGQGKLSLGPCGSKALPGALEGPAEAVLQVHRQDARESREAVDDQLGRRQEGKGDKEAFSIASSCTSRGHKARRRHGVRQQRREARGWKEARPWCLSHLVGGCEDRNTGALPRGEGGCEDAAELGREHHFSIDVPDGAGVASAPSVHFDGGADLCFLLAHEQKVRRPTGLVISSSKTQGGEGARQTLKGCREPSAVVQSSSAKAGGRSRGGLCTFSWTSKVATLLLPLESDPRELGGVLGESGPSDCGLLSSNGFLRRVGTAESTEESTDEAPWAMSPADSG